MSINSFRKPFAIVASAALLSGSAAGIARAATREPARQPPPRSHGRRDMRPKASPVRAEQRSSSQPAVAAAA